MLDNKLHLLTLLLLCVMSSSVRTGVGLNVAVVADVLLQSEPGQVEVLDNLDGLHRLPQILQVIRCPAVWRERETPRKKFYAMRK